MRNIIFLAGLIINISGYSQIVSKVGIKNGISINQIIFEYKNLTQAPIEYANYNSKGIGYTNCLFFEYLNAKYLRIINEFGFIKKSVKDIQNPLKYYFGSKVELNYFIVDLLIKPQIPIKKVTGYCMLGGNYEKMIYYSQYFDDTEALAKLNKNNFSLKYGIGISYAFKKLELNTEFLNNYYFNEIGKNTGEKVKPEYEIKGSSMIVQFGIALIIDKEE